MDTATIAAGAFVLNAGMAIAGAVWAVGKIRTDNAEKLAGARADIKADIDKRIADLLTKFDEEQRMQDHNFGEVGASVRQYTSDVDKKVREIEIWGRDHYLKIDDFERAIEKLSTEFRLAVGEIKSDIRELLKSRHG